MGNGSEIGRTLNILEPDSAFGVLHQAHALRQLNLTEEAYNALFAVADKFPGEWRVAYQLACLCSLSGDLKESFEWLQKAIDVAGKVDIRLKALDEKDLEPLWVDIAEV